MSFHCFWNEREDWIWTSWRVSGTLCNSPHGSRCRRLPRSPGRMRARRRTRTPWCPRSRWMSSGTRGRKRISSCWLDDLGTKAHDNNNSNNNNNYVQKLTIIIFLVEKLTIILLNGAPSAYNRSIHSRCFCLLLVFRATIELIRPQTMGKTMWR